MTTTDPKLISRLLLEKRAAFTKSAADAGETATKTQAGSIKKDPEDTAENRKQPADAPRKESDPIQAVDALNPKSKLKDAKNPALSKAADISARLEALATRVKSAAAPKAEAPKAEAPEGPVKKATRVEAITDEASHALSQEALAKLASVIISSEEGAAMANELLEKNAGEVAAREMISAAYAAANAQANLQNEFNKEASRMEKSAAEVEMTKAAAVDAIASTAAELADSMDQNGLTEQDADEILKTAAAHQDYISNEPALQHPMLKKAYAQGMDDAAAMEDAAAAGGAPEIPMGGEEITEEKIMAVLEQLVAAGQIEEDDAMAIVQELSGGGAPEGAPVM